jgi:hypothetical protein
MEIIIDLIYIETVMFSYDIIQSEIYLKINNIIYLIKFDYDDIDLSFKSFILYRNVNKSFNYEVLNFKYYE